MRTADVATEEAVRPEAPARPPHEREPAVRPAARPGRRRHGRRRHGRFRRWILRPVMWGLALLAVVGFLFQLVLDTSYARQWASTVVAERLGAFLDRRVEIDDLSLALVPLSVEVWGLRIAAPDDFETDLPFLEVPWAAVDADFNALQKNVVHLRQIRVERPRINLEYLPGGRSNVLQLNRSRRPSHRRFDVFIERLDVERAEFFLDERNVKLSISAAAVRSYFEGRGHLNLKGGLTVQDVVVRLPGARPIHVAVSGTGTIRRGHIAIETARIEGPGVAVDAEGTCGWPLEDPRDKKCEFRVHGSTSGEKLAEVGYFPHLEGEIDVDGTLLWRPRTFGWRSRISAPRLEIWDRRLDDVAGAFVADRYRSRLDLTSARYGGGTLDGTIEVATRQGGRPATVDLDFRDVAADQLLADQKIPAGPIAARVSGSVTYRFPLRDGRRGDGTGEVTLRADPELAGLPLVGSFPLRIDHGVVRTDAVSLRSQRQSVLASGFYDVDRRRGIFDYEIESADLVPLIDAMRLVDDGEPWPRWLPTAGEGRLEGSLHVVPEGPSTEVVLQLRKVYAPDLASPHNVTGGFTVDRRGLERLRIQIGDGESALVLQGRVPFAPDDGRTPPDGDLRLTFDAFDWPLTSVHPWLAFELPLDGRISGRLDLRLASEGSYGRLRSVVSPAAFLDVPLDAVSGRLDWTPQQLDLEDLTVRAPAGMAEGHGSLRWAAGDAAEVIDVELRASALELSRAPLRRYLPRPDLRGKVAMTAHLGGSRQDPRLAIHVGAGEVAIGPRALAERPSELDLVWTDGRVDVSGQLLDMVTVSGGGAFGGGHAAVELALDGHDVAGLLELLYEQPPADVGGTFQGRLRIAAEPGRERRVDLALERVEVDLHGRRLANLEPVALRLHPERLEIGSLYLEERATASELFVAGDLGYAAEAPVDLRLQGRLSADWFELVRDDVAVDGHLELLGRLGGTVARPYLDGQARLAAERVLFLGLPEFPHAVEDVAGVLLFYPDAIVVDRLGARLAGGRLEIEGRTAAPRAGEPFHYRLRLAAEGLRLRYPKGWLLAGDAELTLRTQTLDGDDASDTFYLLTGRADLAGLEYTEDVPLGFAQVIQDALLRRRLEAGQADGLLAAIQLNVEVGVPGTLKVDNNLADFTGGAELALRGTLAQPVVYGAVELDPGGQLVYNSVDYEIERGRLTFANPYAVDPEVDLVAKTRVRDFDVILTLTGTADRLRAGFASEPPLPALEVFELLATGGDEELEANPLRRADELGDEQSMSAASFLYGQAASVIGERVSNLFGFDKFRIAPLTGSGDNLSKARVTVGKRLSKDVFVSYSADPASTEEQRLRVEWQVSRGLVLVLTQNGDDTYEADARWETSF